MSKNLQIFHREVVLLIHSQFDCIIYNIRNTSEHFDKFPYTFFYAEIVSHINLIVFVNSCCVYLSSEIPFHNFVSVNIKEEVRKNIR